MKKYLLLILFTAIARMAIAQTDGPKEITPQMLQTINASVEKSVTLLKHRHAKDQPEELEFMIDTFRIEQVYSKKMAIDYSTAGINNATGDRVDAYDKLLNKYYNKLVKQLKPEDRKVLVDAQRAWLAFRDNEEKLIDATNRPPYTGGGTLDSLSISSQYAELIVRRAIDIYKYYDWIIGEK